MSRETAIDVALASIAGLAVAGIAAIHHHLRPLPLHRRAWVQVKARVGR